MSAEDDPKRFTRDPKRQFFDALEEIQRREQETIKAKELADALALRGLREEQIDQLQAADR